ncbi:cell division inhibitor SulA [mine drainage metagenome]|uniref:Cell division inhibitor SulA n=1 Tax=mine drainage metagenome TaxID=410659 RepID=A0A1J5RZY8_9ZZZZ
MPAAVSLGEVLARPDVWRGDCLANAAIPAVASGFARLDAELPGGGWPRGTLTEILADGAGLGECSLLLPALIRMRQEGRWSLLVAPPHAPHGPAWSSAGIDLARLAVVSPTRPRDALWAAEQALASGALGAVLCWTAHADARQVRRLQVAVAGSEALAFLFRPGRARTESSAAALRLLLSAGSRGTLGVDLLKRRGPPCTRTLTLEVPRPLKWREEYESESALAGTPSALAPARSPGAIVFA